MEPPAEESEAVFTVTDYAMHAGQVSMLIALPHILLPLLQPT